MYIILYESSPETVGHGRDGYYFGENGEFLWYDLSKAIGKALVRRGLAQTDEPTSFTSEELIKNFGSEVCTPQSSHRTRLIAVYRRTSATCLGATPVPGGRKQGHSDGNPNSTLRASSTVSMRRWRFFSSRSKRFGWRSVCTILQLQYRIIINQLFTSGWDGECEALWNLHDPTMFP